MRHPSRIRLIQICSITCQMKIFHPGMAIKVRKYVHKRMDVNSSGFHGRLGVFVSGKTCYGYA